MIPIRKTISKMRTRNPRTAVKSLKLVPVMARDAAFDGLAKTHTGICSKTGSGKKSGPTMLRELTATNRVAAVDVIGVGEVATGLVVVPVEVEVVVQKKISPPKRLRPKAALSMHLRQHQKIDRSVAALRNVNRLSQSLAVATPQRHRHQIEKRPRPLPSVLVVLKIETKARVKVIVSRAVTEVRELIDRQVSADRVRIDRKTSKLANRSLDQLRLLRRRQPLDQQW